MIGTKLEININKMVIKKREWLFPTRVVTYGFSKVMLFEMDFVG